RPTASYSSLGEKEQASQPRRQMDPFRPRGGGERGTRWISGRKVQRGLQGDRAVRHRDAQPELRANDQRGTLGRLRRDERAETRHLCDARARPRKGRPSASSGQPLPDGVPPPGGLRRKGVMENPALGQRIWQGRAAPEREEARGDGRRGHPRRERLQLREGEGQVEEEVATESDVRSCSEEDSGGAELDQGTRLNPLQREGGAGHHEAGGVSSYVHPRSKPCEGGRCIQGEDEGCAPDPQNSSGRGCLAYLSRGYWREAPNPLRSRGGSPVCLRP